MFEYSQIPLALLTIAILGCGSPPAPSIASPNPTHESPRSPPARSATSATPTAATPEPAESLGPSPFHIAGELPRAFTLFPLGRVAFLLVDSQLVQLRDGTVATDRASNRGFPSGPAYVQTVVAGEWPDNAFLLATRADQNRRRTELFFWDGHRWKIKLQTPESKLLTQVAPWNLRRVLAFGKQLDDGKPWFRVVAGFPIDPVPQPTRASTCPAEVMSEAVAVLQSGHVFAAGRRCGTKDIAIERWDPGKKTGTIETLPESSGAHVSSVVARDSTRVWVAGGFDDTDHAAFLARLDNTTWQRVDLPIGSPISKLVLGDSGVLFAVTLVGTLWKHQEGGTWEQIPMPPVPDNDTRMKAVNVWPVTADDIWVVATYQMAGTEHSALLHTRQHGAPLRLDRSAR